MGSREDVSWFSLSNQPQEPLSPEGTTLSGPELERWRERFRPFLSYVRRKEVVAALSGGGMALACHVSVLRVLELLSVPVSRIYGTSAGAVIGGLYAAGMSTSDLEATMLAIESPDELFGFAARYPALRLMGSELLRRLRGPSLDNLGIYDLSTVENYVESTLLKHIGRVPTMGELKVDFTCLAFDIGTGSPAGGTAGKKTFSSRGTPDVKVSDAIAASMSIPGILTPKRMGERYYIDGSPVEHLPIATALEDWLATKRPFGARIAMIAVDLGAGGEAPSEEALEHTIDLIQYAQSIQNLAVTQYNLMRCHRPRRGSSVVLLRPRTMSIGLQEVGKIPRSMHAAYAETVRQLSGPGFLSGTQENILAAKRFLGVERAR